MKANSKANPPYLKLLVNLHNAEASWGNDSTQYKTIRQLVEETVSFHRESLAKEEIDDIDEMRELFEILNVSTK